MTDLRAAPFFLDDEALRWVEETISSMSMEEKVGQSWDRAETLLNTEC